MANVKAVVFDMGGVLMKSPMEHWTGKRSTLKFIPIFI
jgi:beta-phosphoglucomutase-like phosphatase (HAD superfamily)